MSSASTLTARERVMRRAPITIAISDRVKYSSPAAKKRRHQQGDTQMINKGICLAVGVATLTSGCASIVNGHNQSLSVQTRSKAGAEIAGANCKLSNDKGVWFLTTPGTTTVHRSMRDITLLCEKEGFETGLLSSKSSTKPMAFGNILFGGVIGAGVDIATGAAYDYPELIVVEMGPVLEPAAKLEKSSKTVLAPESSASNQATSQAPLP